MHEEKEDIQIESRLAHNSQLCLHGRRLFWGISFLEPSHSSSPLNSVEIKKHDGIFASSAPNSIVTWTRGYAWYMR